MGLMDVEKDLFGNGRVRIQVTIPDGQHVSGGPFCCFVKVAPIASDPADSDDPVTVDFIALNVYGRACFRNKLLPISKLQSSLRFSFLTEEREALKNNDNAHLIFSSDAVVFCTCTEITRTSPESYYRFTCTIPPFIPPTVEGENVSCNYYVDITVQYNASSQNQHRETLRGKLEFLVIGSVYPGIPTLDDAFHPFLPKSGGHRLEEGIIGDDSISKVFLDMTSATQSQGNMFFSYDSNVDALDADTCTKPLSDVFLLSRDLNAFWHVWDTMNGSGLRHEPEESYMLRRYNGFVERFTEIILNDPTGKEVEKFRPWFGSMFHSRFHSLGHEVSLSSRKSLVEKFMKKLGAKMEATHGTTVEGLQRAASDSLEMQREVSSDDSIKVMSFSLEGKRLCTCNIQGFGQLSGAKEFTLPVNSWFTIFFDFTDPFKCLQVDINIMRTEVAGTNDVRTSNTCVLQRSLYTLGKSHSNVTMFVPMHATPSFTCSFLDVSYKLELCFYHFSQSADFLKPDSAKTELSKLRMLKWNNPVRLLQSESARVRSRCFVRDDSVPMENTLQMARKVCDRDNMPQLLGSAPALSTSFTIY